MPGPGPHSAEDYKRFYYEETAINQEEMAALKLQGERRRGVATQYCHVITAAVFVSSHIYLAQLMY